MVNLNDVSGCPVGHRCEACGIEDVALEVETATSQLGVMCLTLCRRCAAYADLVPVSVGTAVRLVAQHCAHLGIDLDQMATALDEQGERP